MAWDPDEFLSRPEPQARSGKWNPDEFLARPEHTETVSKLRGIERLLGKKTEGEERLARLKAEPDPMGAKEIAKSIGGEIGDRVKSMAVGAKALGQAAWSPYDTVMDDSKRRQLIRGVGDIVTLGYGNRIANWADPGFAVSEEADEQSAPGYREGGNLAGFFIPGAGKAVVKGGTAVARKAISGPGALKSTGRALTAYEAAAPTIAGLHAESRGDRLGAATDAATDSANLVLTAAGGAVGGAIKNRVAKTKGAQAAQFLEQNPGAAEAVSKLPANDKLIGVASRQAAERVLSGINAEDRQGRKLPFKAVKAQIDASPRAYARRDISNVVQMMEDAIYDLGTDDAVLSKLERRVKQLERYKRPDGSYMVPEIQIDGLRRHLMRMAGVGATDAPGAKEAPLRQAAFEVKKIVDSGPYADINKFYAKESNTFGAKREQLGLKKKPGKDRNVELRKVKLGLERSVQNTKTAGGDTQLDEFAAQNPQYAETLALPKAAQARADLTPRLIPQHGGLIERTVGAHLGPAAALIAAAQGGAAGVAGAAGVLAAQNATPIAGRVLYPLTKGADGARPIKLLMAAEEDRRRRKRRYEVLMGGGRR